MPSSIDKVLSFHMSRLQDKRPDVRLKAIQDLEAMGADAEPALEALKACYEASDELDIKQAAQRAGYSIFMAVKEAKPD